MGDDQGKGIDIRNATGRADFRLRMIKYVNYSVNFCKDIDCQGLIMWSLAGQQYPQPCSSWIGDPRILSTIAPEMDEIADEVFKLITDAGLSLGITLRPQQIVQNPDWKEFVKPGKRMPPVGPPWKWIQQDIVLAHDNETLDYDAIADNLIAKASYANKRWNATMFYTDSK